MKNNQSTFSAVILDLDGVITKTAAVHARAWKRMFDAYLGGRSEERGEPFSPFDIERDYRAYVDGKPRSDGVRSFLESRGIRLRQGTPDDPPDEHTVFGLGNRKNEIFHGLLRTEGVETFDDALEQIKEWKRRGLKMAVVSSSRNCGPVLEAVGITDLFDVKVDGVDLARLDLDGKPSPDLFLEAARRLRCAPEEAIVVEDAVAGVEAGRAGGFAHVVGVARGGAPEALGDYGADVVVSDLRMIDEAISHTESTKRSRGEIRKLP